MTVSVGAPAPPHESLLAARWGRTIVFTALYFSEGGPIGLIWWTLPTLLRTSGVAIGRITTLTAMLVLPWTFKFLWAPLVDAARSRRWGFRAWIITAQLAMGLTLIPLIWLDPAAHFRWWAGLLLAHAISAATQDVAIDAFAINVVPDGERGMLNGAMQAGMLVGRSLFGGGALLVASRLGQAWILIALIACTWSSLVLLAFVREPASVLASKQSLAEFTALLRAAFRRRTTWFGLAFALTGAAAFESAGQLAGPYLLDRGVSQETIGLFFGVAVVLAMVTGGLLGGLLSDHMGRAWSVAVFALGFVAAIAALGVLDLAAGGARPGAALALLTTMYLFIGLFTSSSYALFMDLTDPRLGGTQFSTFMSATNGCEAWSGWSGGQIAARAGYGASFLAMCAVTLVSVPLLAKLSVARRSDNARAPASSAP